jgi:PE family
MSFVTTQPDTLSAAAGDLQGIGADVAAQNAAAATPTTAVTPAAADEVSALKLSSIKRSVRKPRRFTRCSCRP